MEVVAAIICYKGKILCMQRGKGKYDYLDYKFEFPGGKIEKGEGIAEALVREIKEEMDFDILVDEKDLFMTVYHKYKDFDITLHAFLCNVEKETFVRKEHVSHVWLKPKEMEKLKWADADYPIVKKIIKSRRKIILS